jgi:hypothetical protein
MPLDLYAAYVDAGGPVASAPERLLDGDRAARSHRRGRAATGLAEGSPEDRTFAETWFAEFSEDPFTLGDVAMLLDALGA